MSKLEAQIKGYSLSSYFLLPRVLEETLTEGELARERWDKAAPVVGEIRC